MFSIKNTCLLILMFFSFSGYTQCPRNIIYYKGFFYHTVFNDKVFQEKYSVWRNYDKVAMSNPDTLKTFWIETKNDSLWLCSEALERLYNGKKWFVFNWNEEKPVSKFQFDFAIFFMPKSAMRKYEWSRPFFLGRVRKFSAMFSEDGKQLSEMSYKLPGI